eukprot:UN30345
MKNRYETNLAIDDVFQNLDDPVEVRNHITKLVNENESLQNDVEQLQNELDNAGTLQNQQGDENETTEMLWNKIATLREQLSEARGQNVESVLNNYTAKSTGEDEANELQSLKQMVQDMSEVHQSDVRRIGTEYERTIAEMTQIIAELNNDKNTIAQACKEKIMDYDKKNMYLEDELDALASDFEEATLELEDRTNESQLLNNEVQRLRNENERYRQQLSQHGENKFRQMEKEHRQTTNDLGDTVEERDSKIQELKSHLFNRNAHISVLESQLERAQQSTKSTQMMMNDELEDMRKQYEQVKKSKVELINQYATEMTRMTNHIRQLEREKAAKSNQSSVANWVDSWFAK